MLVAAECKFIALQRRMLVNNWRWAFSFRYADLLAVPPTTEDALCWPLLPPE